MQIAGIQKTSTVDFPGQLAAVLFTPGCNFNCFYCHNRQLLHDTPLMEQAEILAFLEKRAGMLDGLVVSGGEPTLQSGLPAFLRRAKSLGYQTKLDTNGSNPDVVSRLLADGLVDYMAVDYKAPFERYEALCGQDARGVWETLALLDGAGVGWELRTTLIPQIGKGDLLEMAKAVPLLPRYVLQLYVMQPGDTRHLKTLLPYTPSEIRGMAELIREIQPNVDVRV